MPSLLILLETKKKSTTEHDLEFCSKLIGKFAECMRPFNVGSEEFDVKYIACLKKFENDCSFTANDMY